MLDEGKIYQRIGEFAVMFQWLESRLREIGWFILEPSRQDWPPKELRDETTAALFSKVERLFLEALPKCRLDPELEADFRRSFAQHSRQFHDVRKARNRILHSAFIELKAGGEVLGLMRSNPRLTFDDDTGEPVLDQEILSEDSFAHEFKEMGDLAIFFNRCYAQLLHRLPTR